MTLLITSSLLLTAFPVWNSVTTIPLRPQYPATISENGGQLLHFGDGLELLDLTSSQERQLVVSKSEKEGFRLSTRERSVDRPSREAYYVEGSRVEQDRFDLSIQRSGQVNFASVRLDGKTRSTPFHARLDDDSGWVRSSVSGAKVFAVSSKARSLRIWDLSGRLLASAKLAGLGQTRALLGFDSNSGQALLAGDGFLQVLQKGTRGWRLRRVSAPNGYRPSEHGFLAQLKGYAVVELLRAQPKGELPRNEIWQLELASGTWKKWRDGMILGFSGGGAYALVADVGRVPSELYRLDSSRPPSP